MKKHELNLTTQYVAIVCILLLVVNVTLGVILMRRSSSTIEALTRRHMLAVADTAAASINGDLLEPLTAADVGSDVYNALAETLAKIKDAQKDSDIKFIYTAKKEGDRFVFTVDADPFTPAEFGEEVVYTPAQDVAWNGVSAIDENPYEDKWGCFYTAWSPVRNSAGRVVGMVGVDFNTDLYDEQVSSNARSVVLFSILSIAIGAAIMLVMTARLRRRIRTLDRELVVLSGDVEKLSDEIRLRPGNDAKAPDRGEKAAVSGSIGELSEKIHTMQQMLKDYMDYAHEQAYTDSMTGVGNKTAYLEYVKEVNRTINSGTAAFAVAVFDVNGLKITNDNYGHECGDRIITDAATIIRRVFKSEQIFRIGGDEFIAVLGPTDEAALAARFEAVEKEVETFNRTERQYAMTLSFSWGGAVYRPGKDSDFKEVFRRADEHMYRNKSAFYREHTEYVRRYEGGELSQ